MSQELICHNPELQRLQSEGFEIEVRGGLLIVHHIPYLNCKTEMLSGTLAMALNTSGNTVVRPHDHTAYWIGQQPCNSDGSIVPSLVNGPRRYNLGCGLISDYYLSCYPDSTSGYKNYYDKVMVYYNTISAAALNYDKHKFLQLKGSGKVRSVGSVWRYDDTNASRAGIIGINERMLGYKVAIIGLGGTGGYLLDYLAKTEVAEIHLYDEDVFNTHNAFRAPGAPSIEQLNSQPFKVDYFGEIYGRMHTGIIPHRIRITKDNISELDDKDMVFICIDNPSVRNFISTYLADHNLSFIDSGMGLECSNDRLSGLVRVTEGFYGHYNHLKDAYGESVTDREEDMYKSNIQIAELNSLAAALSIIQWKKMLGVYNDYSDGSMNFIYSVSGNSITHQKYEG
ncbi:MAG: ThiF family adenylyltransferase [Bacteroidales bacterium]|nr:ThiF family adenylyltransferase [Bacteroidales bacterium]